MMHICRWPSAQWIQVQANCIGSWFFGGHCAEESVVMVYASYRSRGANRQDLTPFIRLRTLTQIHQQGRTSEKA